MDTLVFHHGALGDGVLIWPLLRSLAAEGRVTLIGAREKARLAQRWIPGVRAVDGDSPDFSRLFAGAAALEIGDAVRGILRGAARIVSFISSGADAWAANVRGIAGEVPLYFVTPRPAAGQRVGVVEFHFAQLRRQGLAIAPVRPERRRNGPDSPVIIHPGSGGRGKVWPLDRWEAVLEHLRGVGRAAEVVIGEVERERWSAERVRRLGRWCEVVELTDLVELSERIARAAVFVGCDSGPGHLAAALGVPTVSLFGPSDAAVWAPYGPAVTLVAPVRPAGMEWLPVEAVTEVLSRW